MSCLGIGASYMVIMSSARVGFVASPDPTPSVLQVNTGIEVM